MNVLENPPLKIKQLLADYASKTITLDELNKECAYWYLDCFDEIHPKPYPSAPRDYQDYKSMSYEKRQKMSNEFWQSPTIKTYIEIKEQIKNENEAHVHNLKERIKNIPLEDFVSRSKFSQKIQEFESKDFS